MGALYRPVTLMLSQNASNMRIFPIVRQLACHIIIKRLNARKVLNCSNLLLKHQMQFKFTSWRTVGDRIPIRRSTRRTIVSSVRLGPFCRTGKRADRRVGRFFLPADFTHGAWDGGRVGNSMNRHLGPANPLRRTGWQPDTKLAFVALFAAGFHNGARAMILNGCYQS